MPFSLHRGKQEFITEIHRDFFSVKLLFTSEKLCVKKPKSHIMSLRDIGCMCGLRFYQYLVPTGHSMVCGWTKKSQRPKANSQQFRSLFNLAMDAFTLLFVSP